MGRPPRAGRLWQASADVRPVATLTEVGEELNVSYEGAPPQPASAPQTPPTTAQVPPEVQQAAAQRGFGAPLGTRLLNRPVVTALVYLGVAVACFVLLLLSSWVLTEVFHPKGFTVLWSILRIIPLAFCFGMVGALVYGLRILVTGSQCYFAYTNGLVYQHRRQIQTVAWQEVTELRSVLATRGDNAGKLLHYNLIPAGGKPIPVPIVVVDGRDEFLDQVIAALRHYGKPIN
jgi:hypothetical protein